MGVLAVFAVLGLAWPSVSLATTTFGFHHIPNPDSIDPTDAGIGETQLSMEVSSGVGTVTFTFFNIGLDDMVIVGVYFDDDDPLLGSNTILDGEAGVDFAVGGSPIELPGGTTLDPDFMSDIRFTVEPLPETAKGVGPGETVGFMFDLIGGATLADVIGNLDNDSLRVGLHIIAFADEGGESFVTSEYTITPEPATVILLGMGSLALIRLRRHRAQ